MDNISKIKAETKIHHEPVMQHASRDLYGRMSTQNIVLNALKEQGKEQNFKKVYGGLHHILSGKDYRLLREGNTLFLIKILGNNACHIQLINADSPKKVLKNILEFLKAIQKANYKEVQFDTTNQKIVDFLEHQGYTVKHQNNKNYVVSL